jgi:hypothetical protein
MHAKRREVRAAYSQVKLEMKKGRTGVVPPNARVPQAPALALAQTGRGHPLLPLVAPVVEPQKPVEGGLSLLAGISE